ncbi:hypothetical protein [Nocardia sp. CNY236]|uniref:hypothetical protein n=1 Tax=Nocardia sp. CNY236 TaxID=1169152 RepID=UPI0012DF7319|nr:hypothetical protein [Nocardia sp. CNY236]
MSVPNPIEPVEPEDHGVELGGRSAAEHAHEQQVLDALTADMHGSTAEKLATQLFVPHTPDGGTIGRSITPHVSRITKTRDHLLIWGPGIATTTGALVAVSILPLPGPLALYVLALAAFAWWHCAGRPGPIESVRMGGYALADTGARARRQIEQLAHRRARYETRRTTTEKEN